MKRKFVERLPLKAVEALERLRISYSGTPLFAADQAVQRVVEMILRNAQKVQHTA